jgi:hypothetical protein
VQRWATAAPQAMASAATHGCHCAAWPTREQRSDVHMYASCCATVWLQAHILSGLSRPRTHPRQFIKQVALWHMHLLHCLLAGVWIVK